MSGYLNNTGKIFIGSLVAWIGARLFKSHAESHHPKTGDDIESLEDMDLPDEFKSALRSTAGREDTQAFLGVLEAWQIPRDEHIRSRLWHLSGGK